MNYDIAEFLNAIRWISLGWIGLLLFYIVATALILGGAALYLRWRDGPGWMEKLK